MSEPVDDEAVGAGPVWAKRLVVALMAVFAALLLLTGRAVVDGARELSASDEAFNRGDVEGAVLHARRAAISYAPGAPHVDQSYQRLIAVARGSEQRGDRDNALGAWRAIRAALLETRHIWMTDAQLFEQARGNIARLEASMSPLPAAEQSGRAAAVAEQPGVRPGMVLPLVGGLLLALVGLFGVARQGLPRRRGARAAWYWLGACIAGIGLWLVSVLLA